MDNKILEYQKVDMKLRKLKKEVTGGVSAKDAQDLVSQVKQWQAKILELEQDAKKLLVELEKLTEVQKKGIALVEKYSKTDISKFDVAELKEFDTKTIQTANQLAELNNRIAKHNAQVKKTVLDYEMYRKKILSAKQKREEQKKTESNLTTQKAPDLEALKAKLAELEKSVEPAVLAKYKALKQDGIFPVFVPLVDNKCGGCHMQLSAGAMDKLKNNKSLECEQCRRVICLSNKEN